MSRLLITSGPTREYLDPVRFLTNASSGQMGRALAEAALAAGYEVTVVSGPVQVRYPDGIELIPVTTTEEMAEACQAVFPRCEGVIAAAAPCDFRPKTFSPQKLRRSGGPLILELVETPDIVASLVSRRTNQWIVAFALETDCSRQAALAKLRRKGCDLIVLNGPAAIDAETTAVEVLEPSGQILGSMQGSKSEVARWLIELFRRRFQPG